jgi:hypothetical protein
MKCMQDFVAVWQEEAIVQEVLARIPWYHNIVLMGKCGSQGEHLWYGRRNISSYRPKSKNEPRPWLN